jgi:hypothetical protein
VPSAKAKAKAKAAAQAAAQAAPGGLTDVEGSGSDSPLVVVAPTRAPSLNYALTLEEIRARRASGGKGNRADLISGIEKMRLRYEHSIKNVMDKRTHMGSGPNRRARP